jgi:hypothetical protein
MATMKIKVLCGLLLLSLGGCGADDIVTKAEYEQVQPGMTYEQVTAIVGDPGSQSQQQEYAGIKTEAWVWQNPGGPNMVAMFTNGKLVNKTQIGLQ